jgi:hypothetical protein
VRLSCHCWLNPHSYMKAAGAPDLHQYRYTGRANHLGHGMRAHSGIDRGRNARPNWLLYPHYYVVPNSQHRCATTGYAGTPPRADLYTAAYPDLHRELSGDSSGEACAASGSHTSAAACIDGRAAHSRDRGPGLRMRSDADEDVPVDMGTNNVTAECINSLTARRRAVDSPDQAF